MYLPEILAHTRELVAERKAAADMRLLEAAAARHVPRGFARALRARQGMAVIAELKKASPSRGIIREEFDPVEIALQLEAGGATALSVLTDEKFFHGSLANLRRASAAVWLPCLRKDFMVDEFQMLEARANRADAVLLIVASHTDAVLEDLFSEARRLGLDVLCEVHTRQELERAIYLGAEVIGVNCRDLTTMKVNPRIHMDLVAAMPTASLRVAESGIKSPADVDRLLEAGYDAFLVGEALMRQPDPAAALALLMEKEYASELRGQWG